MSSNRSAARTRTFVPVRMRAVYPIAAPPNASRVRACSTLADWILHIDLDQFLVAVELRRRPSLRGQPVVVGGSSDPTTPRKVVTSASYEAREYGVHAGMPLRTAARRCPHAVFLESDKPAYDAASAEVMD